MISETVTSETVASETVTSETVTSETVTSETVTSDQVVAPRARPLRSMRGVMGFPESYLQLVRSWGIRPRQEYLTD